MLYTIKYQPVVSSHQLSALALALALTLTLALALALALAFLISLELDWYRKELNCLMPAIRCYGW
jgi:hypothetical protein